jgi:O-antigen/teichoic acid export membrane protein
LATDVSASSPSVDNVVSSRLGEVFTDDRALHTVARNVSTVYLAVIVDAVLGFLILPFNVAHLGTAAYGLWALAASVTVHFGVLDLGYGSALVKFVAHYRARRDPRALNEIASTLFFVFALMSAVAYTIGAIVAFHLGALFNITPEQAETGKWVLLIIGIHAALNFPFAVFGGIVTGFQRQHMNGIVAIASSVLVVIVNVAMLTAGYGLVALVIGTTTIRVIACFMYAANGYRVFRPLRISPTLFRRKRLKEVTGFSVYSSIIDWSHKLNYQFDPLVVGAFLGAAPVAIWAVADRIVSATQNLTGQLNAVLFPVIVDSDASARGERLREILLEGTRLSLAAVVPIVTALVVLADPLIRAWVGAKKPELLGSVPVLQILGFAVAIRVGNGTAAMMLKGAGRHRLLAFVNLGTALANVALSVLFVRVWGLTGVALGTLIPVAFSAFFILQPAASRRVGVPMRTVLLRSVWPAVWPGAVMGAVLLLTRSAVPPVISAVLGQMVLGGLLYIALFVLAIGRRDRTMYGAKMLELLGRRLVPAA